MDPVAIPEKTHSVFHGAAEANKAVNKFGLTGNARVANQMEDWADEAKTAGKASEATSLAAGAEEMRGPTAGAFEAMEPAAGAAGAALGGWNMAKGVGELVHGEKGQGGLDVASGGLGIAAGGSALGVEALAAIPGLGEAAMVGGLVASGNEKMKDLGWLGRDDKGVGITGTEFIANETSAAYHSVDNALGGGVLGTVGGGVAGAGAAIGSGVVGLGADLGAGVVGLGESIGSGASSVAHGIGSAISSVFSW